MEGNMSVVDDLFHPVVVLPEPIRAEGIAASWD